MATSSRQSSIFGVNDWKAIYKTYSQADFKSYDYETIRKTFVDYLRTYYPETFNDYVESSEYIALLDVIAFMGQGLAFRDDLNTRENFIDTAERRDSVIKLANLVGYTPKRNLAGQGYVKVVAIQTSEQVKDINGISLNNVSVLWNDPANPNWQEQFNSIVNASLVDTQRIGRPGNSQNILNIRTDEYSISIPSGSTPVTTFAATVDGVAMGFECVSVTSIDSDSIYELPPGPSGKFNMLYRNDKLGYGSPNTGFFLYFKQGTLQTYSFNLAEKISNQVVDINIQGINNTDTWLYELNSVNNTLSPWSQVESIFATGNIQGTNKKIFSVESRYNDQVSYIFGDGVFSDMPIGNYVAYVRSSNALTYTIDPSEFQGTVVTIDYVSRTGRVETLTLTLELPLPVSNAQARESLQSIKERAPQRYYTQNRMVNGEDYNNFPYTLYSSIIKSKALNRTSVGVSRNYDLLDPTGKYSSTNDFADDGGLYQDENDGFTTLVATTSTDIVSFLTENLTQILSSQKAYQYYTQNYTRYPVDATSGDGTVYWNQTSFSSLESTGYFYNTGGPIPAGVVAGYSMKYVTPGALLQFTAPAGKYFDQNNRLVNGTPTNTTINTIWTSVFSVEGDGYNDGEGNLNNGLGPIALSNSIPDGAVLSYVIPSFTNILPTTVSQDCITRITLNQSFTLKFDNTLLATQDRWSIGTISDPAYFVKFTSVGSGRYQVTYRSLAFYFGSVADIRFIFDRDKIIFDPLSGKLMQDNITVLKTNSQPSSNYPFSSDSVLNVVGQTTEQDGYTDDYSVEVSMGDIEIAGSFKNPDFFTTITGYVQNTSNNGYFVFFKQITDANLLSRYEMISSDDVTYAYPTLTDVNLVKYDYPVGRVFYAYLDDKFYQSVEDSTVQNIINVVEITTYSVKIGRQGLYFQYKHISSDTTRVDPSTTNIIDLYVVTQSYYTQYQNWVRDTTGVLTEPVEPTMNELTQSYSNINEYKMLSDSVILNNVKFKPLFGEKAEPKLQATIKVIKSPKTTASDSEIRSAVLSEMNAYFSIENWNFGDTFYFSELSAYLHTNIGDLVSSVVLVPNDPTLTFGDLYEIRSAPYEIFVNAAQATDISVISALTSSELQTS
jgi:hypothetical protein